MYTNYLPSYILYDHLNISIVYYLFEILSFKLVLHVIAKERHKNGYVEQKLNKALSDKLRDLDDKIENAEHSRSFFGEEMYKKLVEIDEKRGEALLFDRGKLCYFQQHP